MSEPGPESVPMSADPRTKRPTKRRALSPRSEQANEVKSLMRDPTKELRIPGPSRPKSSASLPPPPEIVANVQGSSAGAGSGEFHVYKASRRREYERLRLMQIEADLEKANKEWKSKVEDAKQKADEKTDKNRKKREKRRLAKEKNNNNNNNQNGGDNKNGGRGATGMEIDGPRKNAATDSIDKGDDNGESGKHKGQDTGAAETEQTQEGPGVIIHDED